MRETATKSKPDPMMASLPVVAAAQFPAWLKGVLLVLVTILAYWPAMHGGFVWDDDLHISDNPTLRSLKGLWEIWFRPGATMQYYPLSFSVFWTDYHLWGLNTFGSHLQNVLLHGLAAVLLWQILKRLQVPGALLAGAIFALHPVNVMSVAWMTELKNTLSGTLILGAAWAYLRFARVGVYNRGDNPEENAAKIDWRFYVLSLVLFQLALLAKTAVSFLPATLLLIVWWQRNRLQWRDLWPLIPMLGMAAVIGQVTSYVEHHSGGATGEEFNHGFLERILISGRSFWFYLGKIIFPYRLTFIYPRWHIDAGAWWQYVYPAAAIGLLGGLWAMRRRIGRGPFAAMLHFYIGTSFLTLLLVLYMTRYSFVSDHWQYFGCMSVITLGAAGITMAFGFLSGRNLWLKPVFYGALLLMLGVLTWKQCRIYADSETLWRATIERNPASWLAQNNLGDILLRERQFDGAIVHFRKAIAIDPDYAEAFNNLGNALLQMGQTDEAIAQFQHALVIQPDIAVTRNNLGTAFLKKGKVAEAITQYQLAIKIQPDNAEAMNNLATALLQKGEAEAAMAQSREALKIRPGYADAHYNLGNALLQKGQIDEAIVHYQTAIGIHPESSEAHNNLGIAFFQRGNVAEAISQYQLAIKFQPDNAEAHNNLAYALLQKGQAEAAMAQSREALKIRPDYANAHKNLGAALFQNGQVDEAINQFQRALSIQPGLVEAQNDLAHIAWVLATSPAPSMRNGTKAVELAQQTNQLSGGKKPMLAATLAAAYAEAGRFPEAIACAGRAVQLASSQNNTAMVAALEAQLKLYQAGSPFRDTGVSH
jgi:tetratricopeptide (TPR) repeat protein